MNLPNTMIIGASKSATTSLYDLLKNHDNIFAPSFKEPHFFNFDDNFIYQEIKLPIHKRKLPTTQLLRDEAQSIFLQWQESENKIEY